MRGTKSKEKFSQELEMSRSNYSLIESGKSDPTLKTLERIAELTNSTLVIDLIPNELEQVELQIEEEKQWLSLIYLTKLLLIFFKSGIPSSKFLPPVYVNILHVFHLIISLHLVNHKWLITNHLWLVIVIGVA